MTSRLRTSPKASRLGQSLLVECGDGFTRGPRLARKRSEAYLVRERRMNAKMGWLVKPSGLVELQGFLDGQVEGTDQNGVKDGGHGDDGQHGGGELADHAEHSHLDDHEDDT